MSHNMQVFTAIIKKWPYDKTKGSRDLGFYLREKLKSSVTGDKIFEKDEEKTLKSLQRLVNNKYGNKYVFSRSTASTGLTLDQCNFALSDETMKSL